MYNVASTHICACAVRIALFVINNLLLLTYKAWSIFRAKEDWVKNRLLTAFLMTVIMTISLACGGKDGIRYFEAEFIEPSTVVLHFVTQNEGIRSREIVVFQYITADITIELFSETVIGTGMHYTMNYPFLPDTTYFVRYRDMFDRTYSAWYRSGLFDYTVPVPTI